MDVDCSKNEWEGYCWVCSQYTCDLDPAGSMCKICGRILCATHKQEIWKIPHHCQCVPISNCEVEGTFNWNLYRKRKRERRLLNKLSDMIDTINHLENELHGAILERNLCRKRLKTVRKKITKLEERAYVELDEKVTE